MSTLSDMQTANGCLYTTCKVTGRPVQSVHTRQVVVGSRIEHAPPRPSPPTPQHQAGDMLVSSAGCCSEVSLRYHLSHWQLSPVCATGRKQGLIGPGLASAQTTPPPSTASTARVGA